jgi:hypothetical protein
MHEHVDREQHVSQDRIYDNNRGMHVIHYGVSGTGANMYRGVGASVGKVEEVALLARNTATGQHPPLLSSNLDLRRLSVLMKTKGPHHSGLLSSSAFFWCLRSCKSGPRDNVKQGQLVVGRADRERARVASESGAD